MVKMFCTLASTERVGAGIIKSWKKRNEGYDLESGKKRKSRPHVLEPRGLNSYLYHILSGWNLGPQDFTSPDLSCLKKGILQQFLPTGLLRSHIISTQ